MQLIFCLTIISVANSAYGAVADASYCENWFSETNYETVQIESDDLYGCLRFFMPKTAFTAVLAMWLTVWKEMKIQLLK